MAALHKNGQMKYSPCDSGMSGDLISMEFIYDLVLEEGVESRSEERMVEISFVDNPEKVVLDDSILSIITTQRTSKIIRQAIEKIDRGEELEAIEFLRGELKKGALLKPPRW